MEEEVWKDIPGYEGLYQVSNVGNVRSIVTSMGRRKRILSPTRTKWGYYQVVLTNKDGKAHHESIHKLVALAFIPIPKGFGHLIGTHYLQINHKDEDKTNNTVDNLEWVSPSYNSSYGTIIERRLATHRNRQTCSSEAVIRQLSLTGELLRVWQSLADIERETGFCKGYICRCCKGRYKQAYGYKWEYGDWRNKTVK